MIVCKICGFDNEPGAQFCGSCGGFLEWTGETTAPEVVPVSTTPSPPPTTQADAALDTATTAYPAVPPPVAGPGQVICPTCGFANDRDRVFCRSCATELVAMATAPVGPAVATRRSGSPVPLGPAIVVGALLVVVVGGALFVSGIFGKKDDRTAALTSPSPIATPSAPATASPAGPSASASDAPSPSIEAPSEPTGTIAFSSGAGASADIVVAAPDGSGLKRIVKDAGADVMPAWSPDGKRIAYAGKNGIRIVNADGTKGAQFTNHGALDRKGDWSPDGEIIVFGTSRDGDFDLFLRHVGGDDLVRLTSAKGQDFDPSWSVVNDLIAFVSERAGQADIWTMQPDGKGLVQLTGTDGNDGEDDDPAWSPDGTKIAFSSNRDGKFFIYVMNADGTDVHRLSDGSDIEHDPTWSPDGNFIAFARVQDPAVIAIVSAADGSEVGTLSQGDAPALFPAWH